MNVIFVLADSLNKHHLPIYGNDWVKTPNISRFAKRSVTFDQHYTGSAACMPARRDIWTGCLEFPWRNWGPREHYDDHLATQCKDKNIATHISTDHYHYWEVGGTGYHTEFYGCDMIRGHESDYWISDPSLEIHPTRMTKERPGNGIKHILNSSHMKDEADFPTPQTLQAGCDWLDRNHAHGPFMLTVECFDPHEPFHVPPPYDTMYGSTVENETYWPTYGDADRYEPEVLKRIEQFYAAKVTMFDTWFGKLLDRLDKYKLWDDTLIIFTTDHGHYLGEHNRLGKPPSSPWQTLFNIPLLIHTPNGPEDTRTAGVTTAVDLNATITDAFQLTRKHPTHGHSLLPILNGETDSVRDTTIMGYFGQSVGLTDGKYKLHQAPVRDNQPLYNYGVQLAGLRRTPFIPKNSEIGTFIPHASESLVLKAPTKVKYDDQELRTMLYDIEADPTETNDLAQSHPTILKQMQAKLIANLEEVKAPKEQFIRLGLN